jgi:LAO/AO transport system kinase
VGPSAAPADVWLVPIQRTVSIDGTGIPELASQIEKHRDYLRASGGWSARERARLAAEVETILQRTLFDQFHARIPETRYNEVMRQVFERGLSPWEAVRLLTDGSGLGDLSEPKSDGRHAGS